MTDEQRIRALRDQGRITDEQAEQLIAALGGQPPALDTLDDVAQALDNATNDTLDELDQTLDKLTGEDEPRTTDPNQERAPAPDERVQRWVQIHTSVTDLRVEHDPNIHEPTLNTRQGDLEIQATDTGWRIEQPGSKHQGILDRFISGLQRSKATLKLPTGVGLDLAINFGDIETYDIPAIKGRIHAGDFDAHGLEAVNLKVNAGDVDIELTPTASEHAVHVSVGELSIVLPEDANLTVDGRVSVGEAKTRPPFQETSSAGVTKTVRGVLGQGDAKLRATVGTGELNIKTRSHQRG